MEPVLLLSTDDFSLLKWGLPVSSFYQYMRILTFWSCFGIVCVYVIAGITASLTMQVSKTERFLISLIFPIVGVFSSLVRTLPSSALLAGIHTSVGLTAPYYAVVLLASIQAGMILFLKLWSAE
mmetsp:Transcript_6487/g.12853  ORF Transcript_6487/g.12853 Transcript_6487/m.12853 type:complete len:124 (-) Transcript_6487:38-409(-)